MYIVKNRSEDRFKTSKIVTKIEEYCQKSLRIVKNHGELVKFVENQQKSSKIKNYKCLEKLKNRA